MKIYPLTIRLVLFTAIAISTQVSLGCGAGDHPAAKSANTSNIQQSETSQSSLETEMTIAANDETNKELIEEKKSE